MARNVEVSTVNDGEEGPDTTRMATAQQEATRNNSAVAADNDDGLVQVVQSLREQLDRIESTYDSSRKQTISSFRGGEETTAVTTPKAVEKSRSSLFGSTSAALTGGGSSGVGGNGASSPIHLDYDQPRSSSRPSRISSTPPRRTGNTFASPVRFLEPSVMTEDASLQSDVLGQLPGTRTPPTSTRPMKSSLSGTFTGERRTPITSSLRATAPGGTSDSFLFSGIGSRPHSTTAAATPLTPSRSLHSPPPLAGVPTASSTTPFSSQKATNQSFVSYVEPEPVQTPAQQQLPPRGLSAAPELALLDSLLGTVEVLKKRVDEQDVRLERVERDNDMLQEQVRFWRSEASLYERDWWRREDDRYRREEETPELHRNEDRHRDWRRNDGRRDSCGASQNGYEWTRGDSGLGDSPRRDWGRQNHTRSGLSRSDSRRSSEWDEASRQDRYQTSDSTPGSRFVAELSDKLPLDAEQYDILSSLMNRYFVESENGRRER